MVVSATNSLGLGYLPFTTIFFPRPGLFNTCHNIFSVLWYLQQFKANSVLTLYVVAMSKGMGVIMQLLLGNGNMNNFKVLRWKKDVLIRMAASLLFLTLVGLLLVGANGQQKVRGIISNLFMSSLAIYF